MNFKIYAAIILFASLISSSVSCRLPDIPIDPPPVIKHSTLRLPKGITVKMQETYQHSWDDDTYKYEFTHQNRSIASSFQWNSPLKVQAGQSGNTVYFFQKTLICIYAGSRWITWSQGEQSFTNWWKSYEKASGMTWASTPIFNGYCGINKFVVKGNIWTIELRTGTKSEYRKDWSKGLIPPYIHVESQDSGQNWTIREAINKTIATTARKAKRQLHFTNPKYQMNQFLHSTRVLPEKHFSGN